MNKLSCAIIVQDRSAGANTDRERMLYYYNTEHFAEVSQRPLSRKPAGV